MAVVLAIFYSWMTNISVGVPMTSLRFVLGLLIMGAATRADTMGVFVTSQFQGIVGVSLAALVLMRRQGNPFAAEAANGGLQDHWTTGRAGWRQKGGERFKGRQDYGTTGLQANLAGNGMPAAGVLTGLIEGAQPEAGGGQGTGNRPSGSESQPESAAADGDRLHGNQLIRVGEGQETEGIRHTANGGGKSEIGDRRPEIRERLAADGGTVRTMPIRTPKRIASWMPRRVRQQVAAEQRAAAARSAAEGGDLKLEPSEARQTGATQQPRSGIAGRRDQTGEGEGAAEVQTANGGDLRPEAGGQKHQQNRLRQVAVPYRNYRRYRGSVGGKVKKWESWRFEGGNVSTFAPSATFAL